MSYDSRVASHESRDASYKLRVTRCAYLAIRVCISQLHVVMQLHFPRNALCILCIKAFQCMNTGARIVTSVVFFLCVIRNLPPQPFAMSRYHIPPPSEMDSSDTESESDDQPRINAVLSETASKRILLRSDVEYTFAIQVTAAACLEGAVTRKKPNSIRVSGERYTMKFESEDNNHEEITALFKESTGIAKQGRTEDVSNEATILAYFIVST